MLNKNEINGKKIWFKYPGDEELILVTVIGGIYEKGLTFVDERTKSIVYCLSYEEVEAENYELLFHDAIKRINSGHFSCGDHFESIEGKVDFSEYYIGQQTLNEICPYN